MEILIAVLGILCMIAFLIVYGSLAWGYILMKVWHWFIIPVFPDVPSINYWQAVGLTFIISLFRSQSKTSYKDHEVDSSKTLWSALSAPWVFLLIAAIFKFWLM